MAQPAYKFCPYCGISLAPRWIGQVERPACPTCTFIQFPDPKVAVIGLITYGAHVLLAQRAVEPEIGKWALPGGYMDAGEMPEAALRRELQEELALEVDALHLLTILPMGGGRGIVLAYTGEVMGTEFPTLVCQDDVADAGWFDAQSIPASLAFESTAQLLATWRGRG